MSLNTTSLWLAARPASGLTFVAWYERRTQHAHVTQLGLPIIGGRQQQVPVHRVEVCRCHLHQAIFSDFVSSRMRMQT